MATDQHACPVVRKPTADRFAARSLLGGSAAVGPDNRFIDTTNYVMTGEQVDPLAGLRSAAAAAGGGRRYGCIVDVQQQRHP